MVEEAKIFFTYKKNVPYYNVGIRRFRGDTDGVMLTNEFPTYRVEEKDHRDFKMANKRVILEGLIKEVPEEDIEWEVVNALSDEEVTELLKNYAQLKSQLQRLTSLPVVQKIYTTAEEQDKSRKTLSLIKSRLDELTPDEAWSLEDMRGTEVER